MANAQYFSGLARKRMGAGAVLFDSNYRLLLVKPTYKDSWTIPGGVVEADESPRQALIREVREEIGLTIASPQFLCVDYCTGRPDEGDNLQFVFFGGVLSQDQIAAVRLPDEELSDYIFADRTAALQVVGEKLRRRLPHAFEVLQGSSPKYLEDQKEC